MGLEECIVAVFCIVLNVKLSRESWHLLMPPTHPPTHPANPPKKMGWVRRPGCQRGDAAWRDHYTQTQCSVVTYFYLWYSVLRGIVGEALCKAIAWNMYVVTHLILNVHRFRMLEDKLKWGRDVTFAKYRLWQSEGGNEKRLKERVFVVAFEDKKNQQAFSCLRAWMNLPWWLL